MPLDVANFSGETDVKVTGPSAPNCAESKSRNISQSSSNKRTVWPKKYMPTNPPELVIHAGLPKTGTTAIQRYMYFNRKILAQNGIYWADTYPRSNPGSDDWAHHIHSHKWGGWLDPREFPVTPDQAWSDLAESIREKGRRHIISSERFSELFPIPKGKEMLQFIAKAMAPTRVKVIVYVRRYDDLYESHFRQVIKRHEALTSEDNYISTVGNATFMLIGRGLQHVADVMGKENVVIRIYDKKRLVGGDSVSDFLHVCHIPPVGETTEQKDIVNASFNTLAGKVISDPRIIPLVSENYGVFCALRDFFNRPAFERFNKFSLFDSPRRREILRRFEDDAAKVRSFLTEADAKALEFDERVPYRTIKEDEPLLTQGGLRELKKVLGVQNDMPVEHPPNPPLLTYKEVIDFIVGH